MQISDSDRRHLAGLRLCRPYDQRAPDNIGSQHVLILERHYPLFVGINRRGGLTVSMNPIDDVLRLATRHLGTPYDRKAGPDVAPAVFSCSSFTKWLFAQVGVELPRYAIDQSYTGMQIHESQVHPGMLLFYRNSWPIKDPSRSIGHVTLAVSATEMIHGSSTEGMIVREPIKKKPLARSAILPEKAILVTLPRDARNLETALDVARWLQR